MFIDKKYYHYSCDYIFGPYARDELPFEYKDHHLIDNSEQDFACWFIENPINKELVKHLTLRFAPQTDKEFIIVLKAPNNRLISNLVSFINIKLVTVRR